MHKTTIRTFARLGFVITLLTPFTAGAWGRRGHQIIGETASVLASQEPNSAWLKNQSYNMGYYANCPDFIWKRPETYGFEKAQHYMDMEIFQREFAKHPDVAKPFELSRQQFDAKFPDIKPDAGRAYWRIREFYSYLQSLTAKLRELQEPKGEARQKLQEKWLVTAGVMGHYVGDLSMPLHLSENHDGQMTEQKGIHSYYEDAMVDELYPELACEVDKEARKQWPAFTKKNSGKSVLQLLEQLADRSFKEMPKVLAMDKKLKREDMKKNPGRYRDMIREDLVQGSLTLGELYRRNVNWTFDNEKFYFFANEPRYVMPGEISETPPPETKKK